MSHLQNLFRWHELQELPVLFLAVCYAVLRDTKKHSWSSSDSSDDTTQNGSTYQTLQHVVDKYSVTSQSIYKTRTEIRY